MNLLIQRNKQAFSLIEKLKSYLVKIRVIKSKKDFSNYQTEVFLHQNVLIYDTTNANQSNKELSTAFHQLFYSINLYGKTFDQILIIGFGLGSVVELLQRKCPIGHVAGIESNKDIVDCIHKYYKLDHIELHLQDAQTIALDKSYDLIVVDLFEDNIIPKFLLISDYWKLLKKHLSPSGILIWNTMDTNIDAALQIEFTRKIDVISGNTFYVWSEDGK